MVIFGAPYGGPGLVDQGGTNSADQSASLIPDDSDSFEEPKMRDLTFLVSIIWMKAWKNRKMTKSLTSSGGSPGSPKFEEYAAREFLYEQPSWSPSRFYAQLFRSSKNSSYVWDKKLFVNIGMFCQTIIHITRTQNPIFQK